MLRLEKVTKRFDGLIAVNEVDIHIPKQSIFGLLGPNGAGKTTTIRMINQITGKDSGEIYFNSQKLKLSHTEKIGYMPEERGLYLNMKVGEQLEYLAALKGLSSKETKSRLDYWLSKFEIKSWWNKKINELSKGMQQKIQFIATVLHNPDLIIFDEPFTGLDPINTNLIKNEIRKLRENGSTIIFSTHRMEQVEEICEEIALVNKGRIILQGNISELKNRFKKNHFRIMYKGELDKELIDEEIISFQDNVIVVKILSGNSNIFLNKMMKMVQIVSFGEVLPTLNEIFIDQVQGVTDE